MKAMIFVMMMSLFVATGCSSKKKEVESTVSNEVEQVETAMEEKVEEVKEVMAEKVEEMTETSSEMASSMTCTVGSDERTIEIVKGDSPKCEVFYTKSGEKLSIAKANWDVSYCEKVLGQVKGNLESSGFSCN